MTDLKLVTGTIFIDGVGLKTVREIVEPTADTDAVSLAEIAVVGDKAAEWLNGPHIEPLPEDQLMQQLGAETAPRLPGV
jgi:hypothetical protein